MSIKRRWLGMCGVFLLASAWAQFARGADDYNFNWLDPDKKIYVLQNRKYDKAGRLMVSVGGGKTLGNTYVSSYHGEARAAFYLTEALGAEIFYTQFTNAENDVFLALRDNSPNTRVFIRTPQSQMGGLLHWSPWYAKINVFNNIMYFDWYFAAGAGTLNAWIDNRPNSTAASILVADKLFAVYWGTGHQYHVTRNIVVRADFLATSFSGAYNFNGDKTWFTNTNFGLALGYRL